MERIDKIISVALNVSRKDAAVLIKKGAVEVDGNTVKSVKEKFDENKSAFFCNKKKIEYNKYIYIMMNKPPGVISASQGKNEKTVVDILPSEFKRNNLFPAGRLDKDTTGFVLITDDGDFAHKILSPKNHISKTYIADLDKPFDNELVKAFEKGVQLKGDLCMPAKIEAIDNDFTKALVEINQGMYHQIKRMFLKFGITVVGLKRIKMGGLYLDNELSDGESRYITADELDLITGKK